MIGGALLANGYIRPFAVVFCLDATASILASVFFFGPRKFLRGAFQNGWTRAGITLLYWGLILITLVLSFVNHVPIAIIVLCMVVVKLLWALNIAASCGCLGGRSDNEAAQADRNRERYTTATRADSRAPIPAAPPLAKRVSGHI